MLLVSLVVTFLFKYLGLPITRILISASPQVASSSAGDCAFEDDMCGWTNPGRADGLDELNFERLEARGEPRFPQVSRSNLIPL